MDRMRKERSDEGNDVEVVPVYYTVKKSNEILGYLYDFENGIQAVPSLDKR